MNNLKNSDDSVKDSINNSTDSIASITKDKPNKRISTPILCAIGLLSPLLVLMIMDWFYVNKYEFALNFPDWLFWVGYLIFTPVVLYFSYIRINSKPLWSGVLAVLTAILFVPVMAFVGLSFHSWIGGSY